MTPDYQQLAKQEIEKYQDILWDRVEVITNPKEIWEASQAHAAQAQQDIIDALRKEAPLSLSHDHHVILKEAILNYKI